MIDFFDIRETHPLAEFCQSRGMELRKDGSSGRLVALCPLHDETSASFYLYPDGHYHCYGCGAHGDVVNLCAALDGLSKGEAVKRITGGNVASVCRPGEVQRAKSDPYKLSSQEMHRMAAAAHRLSEDRALIEGLCTERPEWNPEAVRRIALEGDIGWENDSMFFSYSHGIKKRWHDDQGKRHIIWECGAAHGECWRQSLLLADHKTIYLCEGEPDAITIVSAGLEIPGEDLVLGLSSCTTYPNPEPFKGKHVIIVPDHDTAGEQCVKALTKRLSGIAASLVIMNFGKSAGNGRN